MTVVSAGPGFGKTTLLGQAVRAHQLEPRGLDVWVSCSAEHERSERLAPAIMRAISPGRVAPKRPGGQVPGAREVLAELIAQAPMEVCLILDDVHEIPVDSPGADLLATVLRMLPTTVHLLLSGRGTPELPMARLEAAGEVLRVGADELAFTAVEVGSLARRLGSSARLAETLHGWPALVRLAFAAGPSTPAQYAREEILRHLRSPQTLALASLAALGTATAGEVEAVAGFPADLADLAARIPLVSVTALDHPNARDAVLACAAEAAVAVGRGDDSAGARAYDELLVTWPPTDRFTERHLRRFLTLGYVLCPPLQTLWDTVDLGPAQTLARAAGRALIAARNGDLSLAGRLPTEHALSFLPLPWSVELCARLESSGRHRGLPLGGWLADRIGPAFHRQLSAAIHSDDQVIAGGAAELAAALPAPPTHSLGIAVLGPLRLTRDGLDVAAPELRRARVRQLLGALVLYRSLSRDRVMDMLWPGLDRASAARNLRVTLTHLRHLLEPDRAGGASYHLQTMGEEVRLASSAALTVDLWALGELEAEVRQARLRGDIDRAAELLRMAVELFRGDPLPDLAFVNDPDIAGRIREVTAKYLEQLLELGELSMVSGDAAPALTLGERVLSLEPFDSRGHRLVLAAALRGRNPVQMTRARQLVRSALTELGAPPDRATSILLQQLSTLLGAHDRLGFGVGPTGMARRRTG